MLLIRLLTIFLLAFSSSAFAGSVSVNMSNSAAQFEAGFSGDGSAETQGEFFYNDQGSLLVDGGLIVGGGGQDAASGPSGGGGVKVLASKIKQGDASYMASAVALGGQGSIPLSTTAPIALVGEFFASLKIITFGDADRFGQFALRVEMGPPQAKFFVGYREIAFNITGVGSVSLDKGGYMGVKFSF